MLILALLMTLTAEPEPRAGGPIFIAHTTDATPQVGLLAQIGPNFSTALSQPDATIKAGTLVSLRRANQPLPALLNTTHLRLANGDTFQLDGLGGGDASSAKFLVRLGSAAAQTLNLPLTALSAIWLGDLPADTPGNPQKYDWIEAGKKQDSLLLRNGDVVRGTFERITDTGAFQFKPAQEKIPKIYDAANLLALVLEPSLTRVRKPKTAFARVVTTEGSRFSVAAITADATTCTLTTLTGAKLTLSVRDLQSLDVEQGPATYLSDLKPKAKIEPFGDLDWPWQADLSVKGIPLMLDTPRGEETYSRGLGLHSKTTLTYALGGKFKRFEAHIGLDPRTGRRGHVDVRILLDGKEQNLPKLKNFERSSGVFALRLDVSQAKELALIVDYGTGGDTQDDVNFAEARLIE